MLPVVVWVVFAGRVIVATEELGNPEAVFVLSGDRAGRRIESTVEVLPKSAKLVIFTSRSDVFDPTDEIASYLASRGVGEERVRFVAAGESTAQEAESVAAFVGKCGWRQVAAVTSPYASRRAGLLLNRAIGEGAEVRVVASKEPFDAWGWWAHEREAEIVVIEWIKSINSLRHLVSRPRARDLGTEC